MEQLLSRIYGSEETNGPVAQAMQEAEEAVEELKVGSQPVELSPQTAYIRRLQHQIAERYHLMSRSVGKEPQRRVTIFKGNNNSST